MERWSQGGGGDSQGSGGDDLRDESFLVKNSGNTSPCCKADLDRTKLHIERREASHSK